ncbi:outer dynein arm-docking complex subunit 4 [Leptinotarsa decemlineata]|uniref:outer dynein arm-docking complex subunit 4 n=1 Tax=Leptinotarsa decemlineata TaxID=7539 RepID=UPI003D305342
MAPTPQTTTGATVAAKTTNPFGKKDEIYGFQTLFRELGYYISRLEHYEKSLKFFDEAIKNTPNDKRALIGRSRARAKACQYEGAIVDINKALNLDPEDLGVIADKALNTYLSCEFEDGLVQNTRMLPIRKKPDSFSMGVMHCSNAIENCIGERAGRPLRDHFKIIRRLAWKQNYEAQKPFEPKPKLKKVVKQVKTRKKRRSDTMEPVLPKIRASKTDLYKECRLSNIDCRSITESLHSHKSEKLIVPPFNKPFPFSPLQKYTTNIENYMAEKYLDSMYLDKIFLQKLQNEPGAVCPNKKGSMKIKQLAKTGFKTVAYKQELLRTRRPFYYINYQQARSSGTLKSRQEQELVLQQQTIRKEADVVFARLRVAFEKRNLLKMLDLAEKLRHYCEIQPHRLFPDKEEYMEQVYKMIRTGYFMMSRLNPSQLEYDQDKRILVALGLPISREPSSDSVIQQFKNVFVDHKKRIQILERRLKYAEGSQELCWCFYELARSQIEQKRWELARVYSRKCVQEANIACDWEWAINGNMLLAKINIQQHNRNDARAEIVTALRTAKMMKNDNLREYLEKCLAVVDKIEFDDVFGPQVLEKREKRILQMMGNEKMRNEFAHLFRMMAAMPASRRMTVIPGIRVETAKKHNTTRMSIMGSGVGRKGSSVGHSMKASLKKEDPKGVGFMELVQFHL